MTEQELQAAAFAFEYSQGEAFALGAKLLTDYRRLQGLIKQAEWSGPVIDQRATCPWCLTRGYHADNCPAFGR